MTGTQKALIAAGLYIGYRFYTKQQGLGALNFYPASVKKLSFDGVTPILTFGLAVQNTSNQTYTLNSMAGNVYANNYLVGNVGSFVPQTIAANSQTIIDIKVRMSLIGIVTDIINAIKQKKFAQTLELDSYINVDGLQVPVDIDYKFGK